MFRQTSSFNPINITQNNVTTMDRLGDSMAQYVSQACVHARTCVCFTQYVLCQGQGYFGVFFFV